MLSLTGILNVRLRKVFVTWVIFVAFSFSTRPVVIGSSLRGVTAAVSSLQNWDSEEMSVPRRPKITGENVERMQLKPGTSALWLECQFTGNPTPQTFWLMNSKTVPKTYEIKTDVAEGKTSLQIPDDSINTQSETNLTCVASNFLGSATKSFILVPVPLPVPVPVEKPTHPKQPYEEEQRWEAWT